MEDKSLKVGDKITFLGTEAEVIGFVAPQFKVILALGTDRNIVRVNKEDIQGAVRRLRGDND